jgi:hypothetical protein
MSSDKLVFDLSQEIEGSPNVFVKKDWLNILDNMNQNYNSNQSIIDTSQLANSSKFLSYREAYLLCPMMLTLSGGVANTGFQPNTVGRSADYAVGLKNWFGQIIHSLTLDYNGTTIIQQTPFINMWNSFKLMTSLSWSDVSTQGSTIGFYPDDPLTWTNSTIQGGLGSTFGSGVCNNSNFSATGVPNTFTQFNSYDAGTGNAGLLRRQQYINYDPDGAAVAGGVATAFTPAYGTALGGFVPQFLTPQSTTQLWKSYIYNKVSSTNSGMLQIAITATIYLKHLHSFFAMCPLLKGVFMKLTLNLNNTSATFSVGASGTATPNPPTSMTLTSVSVPVGGVCPILMASASANQGASTLYGVDATASTNTFTTSLSVGGRALNNAVVNATGYAPSPLAQSIYLYVPAYTFNPIFEQAYLSSPIKQIKYTDVYQYQVLNISPNSPFNNLLTNGIADIKSVLLIPFASPSAGTANTNLPTGLPVYQSIFDCAGCGMTTPLTFLTNFNVVVSGQNAIYNTERYNFEQFNNQVYGCNAVNGGQTDGLTSGLFNSLGWDMGYNYYYVNVSRMLPVEESVPKSVQIIGTNTSVKNIDLWCFIEYGVDVSIDILTGSRV